MFNFLLIIIKEYILIILVAIIFFLFLSSYPQAEENIFVIDNVEVKGSFDLNFKREKYINKAISNSFNILISKILLTKDLNKVKNTELSSIKSLVDSFQILKETYRNNEYNGTYKIFYNNKKVRNFLNKKNISYSQPKSISVIFYPVFVINDKIISFNKNYFYKEWNNFVIPNELINFILPIEDLEEVLKIEKSKNNIEELNLEDLIRQYNIKDYVFTFMNYKNDKINVYVMTNFSNNKTKKNFSYTIKNINDEIKLSYILKDLKIKITDIWREENVYNLSVPLSITLKFNHKKLPDIDRLKKSLTKINIIDDFLIQNLDINNSHFKIYYYGNPRKLEIELLKFGYKLKNDQGYWIIYKK
jgi:hypothetical protein